MLYNQEAITPSKTVEKHITGDRQAQHTSSWYRFLQHAIESQQGVAEK